jgi:EAL domain-containing protein (putative c-di-GMP-specific phosphodiesterase class I)
MQPVTCEAISDSADEAIAIEVECDLLQGYRYGTPRSIEAFIASAPQLPMPLRATG